MGGGSLRIHEFYEHFLERDIDVNFFEACEERYFNQLSASAKLAIEFSDLGISTLDYLLMKYYPRPGVLDES